MDPSCGCVGPDAEAAWLHLRGAHTIEDLRDESHFTVRVRRCACGLHWVSIFTELVDLASGDDSQAWVLVPADTREIERLRAAARPVSERELTATLTPRRMLVRVWPRGGTLGVEWVEGPLMIFPHD